MKNEKLEKTTIKHLRKICEQHHVSIEIRVGDEHLAIVKNDDEFNVVKNGFDVNLVEEIEELAKDMKAREDEKFEETKKRLNDFNPDLLPDSLFSSEDKEVEGGDSVRLVNNLHLMKIPGAPSFLSLGGGMLNPIYTHDYLSTKEDGSTNLDVYFSAPVTELNATDWLILFYLDDFHKYKFSYAVVVTKAEKNEEGKYYVPQEDFSSEPDRPHRPTAVRKVTATTNKELNSLGVPGIPRGFIKEIARADAAGEVISEVGLEYEVNGYYEANYRVVTNKDNEVNVLKIY
jgi:hypothetical protein